MIFLDANYFINLYVKPNKLKKDKLHEKNHKRAKEIYKIIENKQKLISNLTIIEVITVLNVNQKQDPYLISKVYKDLNNNYDIVNDTVFHEKGFNILKNEFKKNKERLPLFDCIYMALMQELEIKEIVSFDEHFDNKEDIVRIH